MHMGFNDMQSAQYRWRQLLNHIVNTWFILLLINGVQYTSILKFLHIILAQYDNSSNTAAFVVITEQ